MEPSSPDEPTDETAVEEFAAAQPVSAVGVTDQLDERPKTDGEDRPSQTSVETAPTAQHKDGGALHLATSTFLSLVMVLALLLLARLMVPSLVESIRYGWHRGELRAEYELSGERLRTVSLDSLQDVSKLVSQRIGPSVVHINVLRTDLQLEINRKELRGPLPNYFLEGQGSGFVFDPAGYILTNQHVVAKAKQLEVTLSDGRRVNAEVVGADELTDLAVLKVDAGGLMAAQWDDSDEMLVGEPVWAVGSPFGIQHTVTFGILSGKHRVDLHGMPEASQMQAGNVYGDLMQSDVVLYPGNSGGPLANSLGKVVGVNAAILGETFQGISFSIPSNVAKIVAKQLVEHGSVQRGWLGVLMQNLAEEELFDAEGVKTGSGVRIIGFPKNSPARKAGLRIQDIIVKFEGKPIEDQAELMRVIGQADVGKIVRIEILRDGQPKSVKVKLGRREIGLSR